MSAYRKSDRERTGQESRFPPSHSLKSRAAASEDADFRIVPERRRAGTSSSPRRSDSPSVRRLPGDSPSNRRQREVPAAVEGRHARHTRRWKKRRRARRIRLLSGILLAAVAVFAIVRAVDHMLFQEPELPPIQQTVPYQALITVESREDFFSTDVPEVVDDAETAHFARKDKFFTVLLAGVDDHNGGSDTIILAAIDVKNQAMYGLSIPRDSKAVVGNSPCKINATYKRGGMPLLASTISDQLGVPVDYTVEVNLEAFSTLIDTIGGVDFEVPLNMDYDDPEQDLSIHVKEGPQHLNGETALKVVRFRHNNDGTGYGNEDYGRMHTQQAFLKAVAKKLLTPATLTKVGRFAEIFRTHVTTELTVQNLAYFARAAIDIGPEGVEFSTLPGEWRYPYVYTDPDATLDIVNAHLNPYQEDRVMEDLHIPS